MLISLYTSDIVKSLLILLLKNVLVESDAVAYALNTIVCSSKGVSYFKFSSLLTVEEKYS